KKLTKRSFSDYVKRTLQLDDYFKTIKYKKSDNEKIELYLNYQKNQNTKIIGDVNLRKCEGTYLTSIQTVIKNVLLDKLGKKFENINPSLFLMGLNLYASVTVPEPKFDSQSKTRMTLNIRESLILPIKEQIKDALDDGTLEIIKSNIENRLQKKFISSQTSKTIRISASNKLKDCIKIPGDVLYIVEGDSALAPLKQIRNIKTQAIYPVKGKVLNVEKSGLHKIQKNKEISDLIEALGPKDKRRYKKIKILADADTDGMHICVLILLVLLKFGDDFIKNNQVSVILTPLYGATKGKQFIPIYSHEELSKYPNYDIMRFKGLGEMSPKQLKSCIASEIEYIVQFPDNDQLLNTLLNIIKNSEYKQKMLKKKEFNFGTLLNNVLTSKKEN
ncbi:MAG TPA: toprim domain-containing protein, partial [Candidatus Nanoarchaeia archaeon]|nr:toprim domain-containing protein [Candidatus Nanoarchaeia archaeon]